MQGTALGAYRDKDFTPTEKDIDIGVLQEYLTKPKVYELASKLLSWGCDVEIFAAPFCAPRTLVVWAGRDVKLDIVGMARWKDKRFTQTPIRSWTEDYALVHHAAMLENYAQLQFFGREYNVPYPIEEYLELEYGPDWQTPKEDHVSKTRVYGFLSQEKIPNTLL